MKNRLNALVTFAFVVAVLLAATSPARAQTAADQAQVIADILAVIEAENAYAVHNGGYFSNVTKLGQSGGFDNNCDGIGFAYYPPTAPDFIEPRLGKISPYLMNGYSRSWIGVRTSNPLPPEFDPESAEAYAYTATRWDPSSGRPSFLGTDDGTIYIDRSGARIDYDCPWQCNRDPETPLCTVAADVLVWPGLSVPKPGATLSGASVTFRWAENDVPVTNYRLVLGTTEGASDLFDSGLLGAVTSVTAIGLPTDGSTVYARLDYFFAGRWENADVIYRARNLPPPVSEPELLSPAPSATLSGSSELYEWTSNETRVRLWRLKVGSQLNTKDYFFRRRMRNRESVLVKRLPTDGSLVFTRLLYRTSAGWRFTDSVNMAALLPGSKTPTLDFPIPGSDLPSDTVLASWSANKTRVKKWWVYAGSERGRNDYFNSGPLRATSLEMAGLPADGSAVYVRLWYRERRRWRHRDYAFGDIDLGSEATFGGQSAKRKGPSRRPR